MKILPDGPLVTQSFLLKSTARIARFTAMLALAWVVMAWSHECGHLIGGAISGGVLTDFDLTPSRMPFSLHSPDPHPLVTLWSGPIIGVLAPLLVALLARHHLVWFVADFCLLANGVYLALAWITDDRFLDTPRLLQAGASPVWIGLFCLATIGVGYPRFRSDWIRFWADT